MEETRFLAFINPATGEQFGRVEMAKPGQVQQITHEMRAAFKEWVSKPVAERVRILRILQGVIIDSADEITAVMTQDCGKSRQDALSEIFMTIDMLSQYLKHADRWLARRHVPRGLFLFKTAYVEPRPYGVVAVIAPWNYPFALAMPPVLGALVAGNTVILKPSEVTGATGVMLEKLFQRVPELTPFVRVLHGDAAVGAALVASCPDYIFLTGSTITGKRVMQAAAENLIPVACELGGKDAMIVLEDADIQAAAHWGAWGAYYNTGQTCMSVERVYVVEAVYDAFVRHAVEETQKLSVGYSEEVDSPYYLGPITDPRQIKIIERHMEDALAKGARALTGGRRKDMFFEPTVLVDVDHSMQIMRDETFGPILPIVKVKDEAEAIRMANDNAYGLGASIWSQDLERAKRVARQVEAATAAINDTIVQFALPLLPFGGIKQSGYGRTHGKEGLIQFTRPYSYVVSQPPVPWDLTVIARNPGNYRLLSAILHVVFGVSPRQRVQPLVEALETSSGRAGRRGAALGLGAALATTAALAGVIFTRRAKARR